MATLLEAAKKALAALKECQSEQNGDDPWEMPWPEIDELELAIEMEEELGKPGL